MSTRKRERANQGTMWARRARNSPTGIASSIPVSAGMAVSRPTWKSVAPSRTRNTDRKLPTPAVIPTPMPSISTLRWLRCSGVSGADQDRPEAGLRWRAGGGRCGRRCGL